MRHTFCARSCRTLALAITALPFAVPLKAFGRSLIALLSFPSTASNAGPLAFGCAIALPTPARRANDKRLAASTTRLLDAGRSVSIFSNDKESSPGCR